MAKRRALTNKVRAAVAFAFLCAAALFTLPVITCQTIADALDASEDE